MKVKCVKDFGFFKEGNIYSAFRLDCSYWTIFFNDKDEMVGGARKVLDIDFSDFFSSKLKESDDERIKSAAIEFVIQNKSFNYYLGISKDDVVTWIEKQCKPTWNEDNENEVAILEAYIRSKDWSDSHINRALGIVDELVNKIKSSKPQTTWTEKDEEYLDDIVRTLRNFVATGGSEAKRYTEEEINWLKSKCK